MSSINSNNTQYYDNIKKSGDDNSDDDSFESALCEMYNDVLFHAIIPEEEEFHFSCVKLGGNVEDQNFSTHAHREQFLTTNRESYLSLRSAAPSMGSSFMLSVGENQSCDDDDLSYMTENDMEERKLLVKFEGSNGQHIQIECMRDTWVPEDSFEEREVPMKYLEVNLGEKSTVPDLDDQLEGEGIYGRDDTYCRNKTFPRNTRSGRDSFAISGGMVRSTTETTLECTESSSRNASFCSISFDGNEGCN